MYILRSHDIIVLPNERNNSTSVLGILLKFGLVPVMAHRGGYQLIREHPKPN